MSTLKGKGKSTILTMTGIQRDAISEIIAQNIDLEVNFDDVKATLPTILSGSNSVVKVNNHISDDFIACSMEGLISLIQHALDKQQTAPSFFDGMESFDTKEKTGMAALHNLPPRAAEYSKEDADVLSRLLGR